jgi:hypothetical protein
MMMRTLTKALLVAGMVAAFSMLGATVAGASATGSLVWVGTTGTGTTGSDSIDAQVGDVLTIDLFYTTDAAGVKAIAVTLDFDYDLEDELDLVSATEYNSKATYNCSPFPTCYISFGPELSNFNPGVSGSQESSAAQKGSVNTFEQQTGGTGPNGTTIRIGTVVFTVTANVNTDGDLNGDLEMSFLSPPDGYLTNALGFVGPNDLPNAGWIPGFAVVAPEPGTFALIGLGVLGIAYAGRKNR